MTFDYEGKSPTMTVTVTSDHIRETLEMELERRTRRDHLLAGSTCDPIVRGYCSSCPVANAIWENVRYLGKQTYIVDINGMSAELAFTNKEMARWWELSARLPEGPADWIEMFDEWLGRGEDDPDTMSVQELLDHPDEWPAPPEIFELQFERLN